MPCLRPCPKPRSTTSSRPESRTPRKKSPKQSNEYRLSEAIGRVRSGLSDPELAATLELPPPHKAIVAGRIRAIALGYLVPRGPRAQPPIDAVQDLAVIRARDAWSCPGRWCTSWSSHLPIRRSRAKDARVQVPRFHSAISDHARGDLQRVRFAPTYDQPADAPVVSRTGGFRLGEGGRLSRIPCPALDFALPS